MTTKDGARSVSLADALRAGPVEAYREFHHPPTDPLDENGQGNAHWSFAFAAHRAVVDVDEELGLVRVVQVATAQDIGKALNPLAVIGQIEGGIAQGLGLAVMEEIVVDGRADPEPVVHRLPAADSAGHAAGGPDVDRAAGAAAPRTGPRASVSRPTISSTGAIVAAIRAATGRPLDRVPVRPDDIALTAPTTAAP